MTVTIPNQLVIRKKLQQQPFARVWANLNQFILNIGNKKSEMKTQYYKLIVEGSKGNFWGQVTVNDNLIVDNAPTIDLLEVKFRKLILEFEGVTVDQFEIIPTDSI